MSWRQHSYGRITGGDIERCLSIFREAWEDRLTWSLLSQDHEKWSEAVQKLIPISNWTAYYQLTLVQLLARFASISGIADKLAAAAERENPAAVIFELVEDIPDAAPDHPEAIPLAFAMIGNLDAIARYSRSINDIRKQFL